ncbi:MAG: hypothetical protein WDZ31_04235 [Phycisphaeraceae bacterium]
MSILERTISALGEHATILRKWIGDLDKTAIEKPDPVDHAGSLKSLMGIMDDTSEGETGEKIRQVDALSSVLDEFQRSSGDDMRRRLQMLVEDSEVADNIINRLKGWRDAAVQHLASADEEQDARLQIQAVESDITDTLYALRLKGEAVAEYIDALADALEHADKDSFVHATDRTPEDIAQRFGYQRTVSDVDRYSDLAEQCLWGIRGLAGWFRAHETPRGPSPAQGQWLPEAVRRCAEVNLFPDPLAVPEDADAAFDKAKDVILRYQLWRRFQGTGPQVSLLPTDRWALRHVVRAANHDFYADCAVSPIRLGSDTYPSAHSAAISGIGKIWTAMENHQQTTRLSPAERSASWDKVLNDWGSWELEQQVQNAFAMLSRERVDARKRLEGPESPAATTRHPHDDNANEASELAVLMSRSQSELANDLIKRLPDGIPKKEKVSYEAAKQQIKNAVKSLGIRAGTGGRYSGRNVHRILKRIADKGRTLLADAARDHIAEETQVTARLQQMKDESAS